LTYRNDKLMRSTLCCFFFLLCRSLSGQAPQAHLREAPSARIYYTGDLFGYVRWPDQQLVTDLACPTDPDRANATANTFLSTFAVQADNKILVGVGNNFAPELFSRLVDPVLGGRNKDRFVWDYLSSPPAWRTPAGCCGQSPMKMT